MPWIVLLSIGRRLSLAVRFAVQIIMQSKEKYSRDTLFETFDRDVWCPICLLHMAYAHTINPCGHTLCGSCGVSWFITYRETNCPSCSTKAVYTRPLIPNIAMNNVVRAYMHRMQRLANDDGPDGERWRKEMREFEARESKWKAESEEEYQINLAGRAGALLN
ncbi:hypothetical protein PM082_003083 [Marasmius tenuissimus]|nr:hypothetical protein PM082_003083 [Marasmius tenuissimus]